MKKFILLMITPSGLIFDETICTRDSDRMPKILQQATGGKHCEFVTLKNTLQTSLVTANFIFINK